MNITLFIALCLFVSTSFANNIYPIAIEKSNVYDGDTAMKTTVTLPFGISKNTTIRLIGINAPELTGKTKEEGIKARDFLRAKIDLCPVLTASLHGHDSFGRQLVTLYCKNENINLLMIKEKMAVEFNK